MSLADYDAVLSAFPERKPSHTFAGRPAFYAACPVCGDKCPTHLRLWLGDDGRMYAKCYGGKCQGQGRLVWWRQLLDATGTKGDDWKPPAERSGGPNRKPRPMRIAEIYPYRDARGRLLYECVKFEAGETQKCAYRRPAHAQDSKEKVRVDTNGLRWVWDGTALDADKLEAGEIVPAQHILYRLPELIAANPQAPVFIPEGEPDVEALRALGFVATCNPHGARNWPAYLGKELRGRRVVLLEDNDDAGRQHVSEVAGNLMGHDVASIRLVRFQPFGKKGFDFGDWLHETFRTELACPAASVALPAWLKKLTPEHAKWVKAAVVKLATGGPEWAALSPAESKARSLASKLQETVNQPTKGAA